MNLPIIFAELLGLMGALIILGEPVRLGLSLFCSLFKKLNFVEKGVLNVYLGSLILYCLALLPFGLFRTTTILALLASFVFIIAVYHLINGKRVDDGANGEKIPNHPIKEQTLVFSLFLIMLVVQMIPLMSFVYGSVHDASFHSLSTQVIVEKGYIPTTLEPYLPEGIIYPQASHVIFAFATNLTGWISPLSVFYVTVLFNSLTVLAVYFFAKRIWQNQAFYLGIVFVFTFLAAWPTFITWGGNPFVVGFALFLICLGLLFEIFSDPSKRNKKELVVVGILFGYLGTIIISFLQSLLVIGAIWLAFRHFRKNSDTTNLFKSLSIMFATSLIPLSPFLFRFAYYYPNPGHNIGLPSDFAGYPRVQQWMVQSIQWALENFLPYPALRLVMAGIIISSIVLYLKVGRTSLSRSVFSLVMLIVGASLLLSLVAYLLPPEMNVVSWGHQGIILTFSLYLCIVAFNHNLFLFFLRLTKSLKQSVKVATLLSVLVLSSIYLPFVYARFALDPSTLRGAYGMFAVTSEDDNNLMLWMKENLTSATVLINPYESGAYIPSVANKIAIFATPGSQLSRGYQQLVTSISNSTLNSTCYSLMKDLNITHIYVGSQASYGWVQDYKWLPELFLGNPKFRLIKHIGDAYLFQFNYVDENLVFQEDFEHDTWNQNGWQTGNIGNGLGNATEHTRDDGSSRDLKITARCIPSVSAREYAFFVSRDFFVQNASDVQLSFYLNATEGFHGNDAFAVIIHNIFNNQSAIISTPNGVFDGYACTKSLDTFEGHFTINLSDVWNQLYGTYVPSHFVIELVNCDTDNVENVALIDEIAIVATPST